MDEKNRSSEEKNVITNKSCMDDKMAFLKVKNIITEEVIVEGKNLPGEKQRFYCEECDIKFPRELFLKKHLRKHKQWLVKKPSVYDNPGPYQLKLLEQNTCVRCGMQFRSRKSFFLHDCETSSPRLEPTMFVG